MSRAQFMRRAGIPAFLALTAVAVAPSPSGAAPIDPYNDPPEPPSAEVTGTVRAGLPAFGKSVDITAGLTIKVGTKTYPVTAANWSIVSRPSGSTSNLTGSEVLSRSLVLDRMGSYTVRVVACPSGCKAGLLTAPATTFNLAINAVNQTPLDIVRKPTFAGRETVPMNYPGEDTKCQGGGGFVDPQWVTSSYFHGPSDYKLLEGDVELSKVAGSDNYQNHYTQDWNLIVRPDAPFRYLQNAQANPHEIEVEWETGELPDAMRPNNGDRVSAFGYHILDCGHGENGHYRTEIHPPVLWAVHRPRTFQIPSDQPLDLNRDGNANEKVGTNVFVSGVVSDVWVNAYSGEITGNGSESGLAQPSTDGTWSGAEIGAPANLKRSYTFNVYLPRSPQAVAKAWGKADAKPTPLYFRVKRHPDAPSAAVMGPMPTIVPVTEGDVTYLRVTLDLTGFTGHKLAQQIEAGWVYPSADNWGLESWRLSVPKLTVRDAHEIFGDWNFWLGANAPTRRWTKIFSCNNCVTADSTYYAGSSPWQGMSTGGYYADIRLLPSEPIRLFATGYEADTFVDDGISRLNARPPKIHGYSGSTTTAHHTVYYNVASNGAVTPSLSDAARALFADYTLTGPSIVAPPSEVVAYAAILPVEEEEEEGGIKMLGGLSLTTATSSVARATPTKLDKGLAHLRAKIDARLLANPGARTRIVAALTDIAAAVPATAWNAHFADLYKKP